MSETQTLAPNAPSRLSRASLAHWQHDPTCPDRYPAQPVVPIPTRTGTARRRTRVEQLVRTRRAQRTHPLQLVAHAGGGQPVHLTLR